MQHLLGIIMGVIQVLRNARGGGWVGICPSVTKRYEGVGGGYVSVT